MMEVGGSLPPFSRGGDIAKAICRTIQNRALGVSVVVLGTAAALTLPLALKTFNLARAGTAYSAKILCSGVLMAGMDANRLKREDLALAQGLIQTQIDVNRGVVHAWAFLGLVRGKAVRQGTLGCSQAIANTKVVKLPDQRREQPTNPIVQTTPWKISSDAADIPPVSYTHLTLPTKA